MSRPSPSRGSLAHGFIPQGIALGLYLSRAIAESSVTSWRLLVLLPLAAASISLGILLTSLLGRAGQRLSAHPGGAQLSAWPLLLLLGYVLCPWTSATVAWAVALFVAIMLLMLNGPILASGRPARRIPLLEMGVTLGALGLYVATLAPTVLPADAGEFQLVSAVLGIAHPPGYPLYTMLGKLFTLFPVSDMVYRVNLYGAACGALTLAVIAHHVRRTTGSASAALVAAAALGTSTTFWAQSTTANIRSLTALLTALSAHTMLRWGETQESKHLAAFGLVFGLGIGHHSSLALLAPPLAIYALCVSPWLVRQPRRWLPALLAFVLSFTVLLYLPVRSAMGPPFAPSPIRSLAGFLDHVLARGFGGDMLHYRTLPELAARFGVWLQIIRLQFGIPLTLAMFAALVPLAARRREAVLLLCGVWAMNTLSALTYRAPQTVEYLIPSYVALALILGEGLGTLLRAPLRRATGAAVVAVLTVLIALGGVGRYGSMATLHKDRSARAYAEAILRDAPPDTLVLSNWHRATVFWYLQQVEGLRRDVEVVYVYPEGDLPNESVWLRRIGEAIESRPVVVTNRYHGFALSDYRWAPFHEAWLVRADPLMEAPDYMTERVADLAGTVRLLGFQAEGNAVSPGDTLTVHVIWQPLRPLEDLSSFVQLLGPGGVLGQGDIAQPSSTYEVGEVRVDAYRFPVLLQALPGEYELITGFYRTTAAGWERLTTADGADHVMLSKVQVQLATEPPPMLRPQDARYASGVRLVGLDYDRSVAGQTRVYLHWQRPGTSALRMRPWVEPEGSEATVQLLAEGALVAQAALPPLAPGSAFTAVADVPDTLQGLTLRLVAAGGAPIPRLGLWHRRVRADLQIGLPRGAATYVPLGGEMIFLGLGNPPERATPGQKVSLRPRFVAARPLLADYSVSVGLSRPDLNWERKSDGTPARGAIPTLKWIRGWQVEDPRELALPPDAPPGPARVTLAVYDAFTLHPLQVLDDRLARQGLGTHLEPADIEIVHPRRALNRARLSLATAHQQPPLPAGRQGGSPRDRQPVIEFVALPTDAAALDRPRGLATIVALTLAAPDSRRRPRQTERGSVMEG